MGPRITDLGSAEFAALFTDFEHTAYRLEALQTYGVGYEDQSFRAFVDGRPLTTDRARDDWTGMIRAAVAAGKVFQRVHVVREPLTDYLRYELAWWYGPNTDAGDDIRILVAQPDTWPTLPRHDYWLFDSSHLWIMEYADDGAFRWMEQIDNPAMIVRYSYWRDAALHMAVPYRDYMRRAELLAAS